MTNAKKKPSQRGGKRAGSGRKKLAPTSVLSIRMPTAFKTKNQAGIKAKIKADVAAWESKNK